MCYLVIMGWLTSPAGSLSHNYLCPGETMRFISRWTLAVIFVMTVLVVAVACGSGSEQAGSERTSTAPSFTQESLDLGGLTADDIVAAQEQVLNRVYQTTVPSVAHIRVTQRLDQQPQDSPFEFPFPFDQDPDTPPTPDGFFERGEGSGFAWDDQGHIVTNYHVIVNADTVTVVLADGTELEAQVLGGDPDSDLAVLGVSTAKVVLQPIPLGDSDDLQVGQMVSAIGNPFGQEFTLTSGIVSALGRTIRSGNSLFSIPEVIQTDAAINPGNSGGPLLDRQGQVIGINTQIITRSGSNAGVGFAVPINTAKQVIPVLIKEGRYEYAWLGISGNDVDAEVAELMDLPEGTRGALVVEVTNDGPADEAGLVGGDQTVTVRGRSFRLGGDVIVGIDGILVESLDDVILYLNRNTRPDDEIVLDIIRNNNSLQVTVKLGTRPTL